MIRYADWSMRGELAEIWKICFQEPARPAKYFLNNGFRPENSLVLLEGDKIASVVYFLPMRVSGTTGSAQAHYIYAAATLPQFRSRGYMAQLLAAAGKEGAKRGDRYSVVLPATPALYPLYEKSGYRSFFCSKTVSVPLSRLCDLAENGRIRKTLFTWSQLNTLRSSMLRAFPGSVLWSDESFAFAAGMGGVYGDRLVTARTAGRPAYALCRRLDEDTCKVLEVMAQADTLPALAANLIAEMPAETYEFRLPAGSTLFGEEGEPQRFGLIQPLGGAAPLPADSGAAYLGLPLD